MSVLAVIGLLILGWFLYRVFVSGGRGGRSFVEFYRDQNEIRHEIQSKGGIHKVESENINNLRKKGYEISEYGENFVKMNMKNRYGRSEVSVIHGNDGKSLEFCFYNLSGDRLLRMKEKMRSSNGAIDTLQRAVEGYVSGSFENEELRKEDLVNHFSFDSTSDSESTL